MKYMSMIIAVLVIALFFAVPAKAQFGRMSIDDRVKQLEKQLTLTKQQVDTIKVILTAAQDKAKALRDGAPESDPQARRDAMMKQMQETDKQVESLLTADQKKKYDEIKKERMQRRMGGPGGPGGTKP